MIGSIEELAKMFQWNEIQIKHWKTFFDDPTDQEQIQVGIYLWNHYGANINTDTLKTVMNLFNKDYLSQWA